MRRALFSFWAVLLMALFYSVNSYGQITMFVDSANVSGTHDGASWATAYDSLQPAINAAVPGDTIFVAKGTYMPASGNAFVMKDSVAIYGDFVGTESSLSQRNLAAGHKSILKGNGGRVIDNSANHLTNAAVLDGFTITGGYNMNEGGGIYDSLSSPTLTHLIITNNITDGNAYGGTAGGGGMANEFSSPVIINVVFYGDTSISGYGGGAMFNNNNSSPHVTNTVFYDNSANPSNSGYGGAIEDGVNSLLKLTNCTFYNNVAAYGGALDTYNGSPVTITNTLFRDNKDQNGFPDIDDESSNATITYCYSNNAGLSSYSPTNVLGGSVSPFVDSTMAAGADGVYMTPDDGLQLVYNSVAVNAGSNSAVPAGITTDITGAPRIQFTTVDMGAYENNGDTWATISESSCDSLVSPSGKYTWTTSGTYMDTIPNAMGHDSIMTVLVGIGTNATTSSPNVVACDSYTSPSGHYTWTASGTYHDTIQNALGCDSDMTIHLTINTTPSYSTQSVTAVGNYVSPSGKVWMSSGTYMDTIPNAASCDSVMTFNVTIIDHTYVDSSNVSGTHDGMSWATAFNKFQDGMNVSAAGDSVFVAKGTYQPASGMTFAMKKGVKIYGGFVGTESSLSQRNLAAGHHSILMGNGGRVIDNSSNHLTNAAVLDGFTITGGYNMNEGGGIYDSLSSPTLTHLIITNNITDGNAYGSTAGGGGMANEFSSPVISNIVFYGDTSTGGYGGGAMFNNNNSSPHVTNTVFYDNSANPSSGYGGAIEDGVNSLLKLTNCTFYNNVAGYGGALDTYSSSPVTITNTLFRDNTDQAGYPDIDDESNNAAITYCYSNNAGLSTYSPTNVLGGSASPFVDSTMVAGPDGVYMTPDDGLQLACGSQAINTGNNSAVPTGITKDIAGNARIQEGTVDIGAYENSSMTTSSINVAACDSDVSPSGKYTWMASGTYTDTIPNAAGCDSVITVLLTVHHSIDSIQTVASCNSYLWEGTTYTTSGTYYDSLSTVNGCDSILTLHLTIGTNASSSTQTVTACDSYVSPSGNYIWTTSGTYNDTIPNAVGCDSVMTFNLTIDQSTSSSQTTSACDSMVWHGVTYTTSGSYNDTIPNAVGCDSVMTLNLTVNHSYANTQTVTACDSMMWNGTTYNASGTYYDSLSTVNGCDSILKLNLTIHHSTGSTQTVTACDSYMSPSGQTWTSSGTYMDTIPNASGCDSVMTINLTIHHSTASQQTATVCDSMVWNGMTYTSSGTYMDTIPNAAGCDSVMTLNLTVNHSYANTQTVAACNSYLWEGTTYTTSGTYYDSLSTVNGCDSILTLDLTIGTNATSSTQTVTACDSYTSPSGNYTWTTSGSYMDTIPNAGGCDSVMTINLTIDHSTSSSQTATACDSMIWHGMTYTTSGTYNDTIPNAVGCDSVMTLNLTVNHSSSTTQTASACSSYTWNGMTYTSSGMYTDTLASSAGCDSIVTLNLTIGTITVSASQVGDSLVASPAGGTYQWIDCNNGNAAISGATGQSYTPSSNGSYAVIITEGSCTDTSSCATYVMTGISNSAMNNYLKVYPNPSMGSITVSSDMTGTYYLVNELGQRIEVIELTNANHKTVSVAGLANGIYTLVGHHGNKVVSKRIVVTR